MKKTVKTTLAILTAMTMTAGAMGVTAYAEEALQETAIVSESVQTEGVFSQGAAYHFIKGSDALIIDGEGSFTAEEFDAIVEEFNPRAIAFDNEVAPPDGSEDDYAWICGILHYSNPFVVYSRSTSKIVEERKKMLSSFAEKTGKSKQLYGAVYNIIQLDQSEAYYNPVVTRDFVEMFTYNQVVLDRESEIEEYLISKGIYESVAREITGVYLNGLEIRVRNYYEDSETNNKANPDGTEINEHTKNNALSKILRVANQEQEVLSDADSSQYTDEISSLLKENGIVDENNTVLLSTMNATKSTLATSKLIYCPEYETTWVTDSVTVDKCNNSTNDEQSAVEPKTESVVEETENVPTTIAEAEPETEAAATLKGDADVNGEVGLSDVVAVSKHNINSTAYPLANETAVANADMNNDNVVDGLDTSALVEFNLGK